MNRLMTLGDLGEALAHDLLVEAGFSEIRNLNQPLRNYPYVDREARRHGQLYVISVKARNRLQIDGSLKPSYNFVKRKHIDAIKRMESDRGAIFAWVAIQIEATLGRYSAYFGTWDQIGRHRFSIPMLDRDTAKYERLAYQRFDERIDGSLDNRAQVSSNYQA